MPATVIAERVGWSGSITWFRENVRRLRPEHRRPDPADRLVWAPGDAAQCDLWFPPRADPARGRHDGVVAGAGDRRRALAVHHRADVAVTSDPGPVVGDVVADRTVRAGAAPVDLGQRGRDRPPWPARCGCRRVLRDVGDPVASAQAARPGVERDRRASQRVLRDVVHAGPRASTRRPTSTPSSPTGSIARTGRVVRTLKARPIDLVDADRAAMLALPPVPPQLGWSNQIRLGRDYYVRVDSNDYSVDPTAIGRQVTVTADLERVRVRLDGRVVADHARVWARAHDRHRPRPCRHRPAAARAVRPATARRRRRRWCVTSPTTTAPSGSTSTGRSRDGRQATQRRRTRSSRSTTSPPR